MRGGEAGEDQGREVVGRSMGVHEGGGGNRKHGERSKKHRRETKEKAKIRVLQVRGQGEKKAKIRACR